MKATVARTTNILTKALVYALAGAGSGILVGRFALYDYHGYVPALLAGSAFGAAFLIVCLLATTDATEDFLAMLGAATLFATILGPVVAGIKNASFYHTLSAAQIFVLFLASGIGGYLPRLPAVAGPFLRIRRLLFIPAGAAMGSGIGLVLGFVIDPGFGPSMVQDGGALCGSLAGVLLGVLLACRAVYYPARPETLSHVVLGSLCAGVLSARLVGFGAAFITPLAVLGLDALCYFQQDRPSA